jgi:RND family efflux transporter MFP subunit
MQITQYIPGRVRRHKWKFTVGTILGLLLIFAIASLTKAKPPEYVTAKAERGDIRQVVEAVGNVTSDKNLNLQFRTSGIVSEVLVKEGMRVRAGQRLAALRNGNQGASIASASASVAEAWANYNALKQGSRPEDIAVTEASVQNKKAALDVAKSNLRTAEQNLNASKARLESLKLDSDVSLSGEISLASGTISQKVTVALQALSTIDNVFANTDVQDALVKNDPGGYQDLRGRVNTVRQALENTRTVSIGPADYAAAIKALQNARTAVQQASDTLDFSFNLISNLATTSYLTTTDQTTYKDTIGTQRTAVLAAIRDLDAAIQSLKGAPSSLQSKITAEEANLQSAKGSVDRAKADIMTYETSLKIDEAQLQLKKAGARDTDLAAALARVRQAQASLARASADYADTLLVAPVDGLVTKVAIKAGEASPLEPAISIMGNAPYRIEMFVSEIDIPKVALSQSGSVELDAFRGTNFKLHVSQVDLSATDKEGVPKYRVLLDFNYPHDELKIGMTGDASIETGVRQDVVYVPLRAVIENDAGQKIVRILTEKGKVEERQVRTGMEGEGGNVEVLGVKEGETVIVLEKK